MIALGQHSKATILLWVLVAALLAAIALAPSHAHAQPGTPAAPDSVTVTRGDGTLTAS